MHVRPTDRPISLGWNSWWNSFLRTVGSRRWRLRHAESVNAGPNPRIDWDSSPGSIAIASLAFARAGHASDGNLACRCLPTVVHTEIARSAAKALGMRDAIAPAADSLRKSRRVKGMPAPSATHVPVASRQSGASCAAELHTEECDWRLL